LVLLLQTALKDNTWPAVFTERSVRYPSWRSQLGSALWHQWQRNNRCTGCVGDKPSHTLV